MRALFLVSACLVDLGYGSRIRSTQANVHAQSSSDKNLDEPQTRNAREVLARLFLAHDDPVAGFQVAQFSAPELHVRPRQKPAVSMMAKLKYKVTVNALKESCKTFGLKVSGSKADLISRLEEHPEGRVKLQGFETQEDSEEIFPEDFTAELAKPEIELAPRETLPDSHVNLQDNAAELAEPEAQTESSVPKHLPVTYIDAEHLRGLGGFKLEFPALLAATAVWAKKNNLQGRVVLVIDHGAAFQGFYVRRHGVGVVFSGPNQTADDVLEGAVHYLASEQQRNALLVTEDTALKKRCSVGLRLPRKVRTVLPLSMMENLFKAASAVPVSDESHQSSGDEIEQERAEATDTFGLKPEEITALKSGMSALSGVEWGLDSAVRNAGRSSPKNRLDVENFQRQLQQAEGVEGADGDSKALMPAEEYTNWVNSPKTQAAAREVSASALVREGAPENIDWEALAEPAHTLVVDHFERSPQAKRVKKAKRVGSLKDRLLSYGIDIKGKFGIALFDGSGKLLRYAQYIGMNSTRTRTLLHNWMAGKLERSEDSVPEEIIGRDEVVKRAHWSRLSEKDTSKEHVLRPVTHLVMQDIGDPKNHQEESLEALKEEHRKVWDSDSELSVVDPHGWQDDLLLPIERRSGKASERSAYNSVARQVCNDRMRGGDQGNLQSHESAAISLGYWATRELGWVTTQPALRRYINGNLMPK